MKTIKDLQPSTRHVPSQWRFWHERKLTCTADPFIELSKAMWSAYWTSEWRDRCSKVYQCSKRDANTPWCHANDTRLWPLTCNFSCALVCYCRDSLRMCTYIILLHFADANNERPHITSWILWSKVDLCALWSRGILDVALQARNYIWSTPDKSGSMQPSSLHAHTGCLFQDAVVKIISTKQTNLGLASP